MKTNIAKENKEIADKIGIPVFKMNEAQRNYYPYHLRHCSRYLGWILAIDFILVVAILFLFFTQKEPDYYLTAFNGKNTLIIPTTLEQASYTTQKMNTQGNPS